MSAVQTVSLSQKAISGIGWSTAAKFLRQFFQLIFQIILARILSPEDFGLLGMIVVFSGLADILKNFGFSAALIQKDEVSDQHYNSVFWLNVFLGLIITGAFQLLAPVIATTYHQPALENITRVYSFVYLIGSFNIVQETLLQKKMEFKRLFYMEAFAIVISGVAALIMAFNSYGVWTLVWQYILITIISSTVLWITSSWKPAFTFKFTSLRELHKFSINLVGADLLNYAARNIDNFLIGKYIGVAALGIYSRAYFLMLQPLSITNQLIARVMFPLLVSFKNNFNELKRIYLKATRLIAFVVFPFITFAFVAAKPFILLLLGSKWIEVATLLRVFCIYCLVDTIGITTVWIYKATGHTHAMFKWGIYNAIIIISAILIGMQWGITGVAVSYTAAFLVFLWIPGWHFAYRIISLPVTDMLKNIAPVFLCCLPVGLLMFFVTSLLEDHTSNWAVCLTALSVGLLFYIFLSSYFIKESFAFIYKIAASRIEKLFRNAKSKIF